MWTLDKSTVSLFAAKRCWFYAGRYPYTKMITTRLAKKLVGNELGEQAGFRSKSFSRWYHCWSVAFCLCTGRRPSDSSGMWAKKTMSYMSLFVDRCDMKVFAGSSKLTVIFRVLSFLHGSRLLTTNMTRDPVFWSKIVWNNIPNSACTSNGYRRNSGAAMWTGV